MTRQKHDTTLALGARAEYLDKSVTLIVPLGSGQVVEVRMPAVAARAFGRIIIEKADDAERGMPIVKSKGGLIVPDIQAKETESNEESPAE